MVSDEKAERFNSIEEHTEVIEEILSVEEVVGGKQEVPRETAEPRQAVNAINLVADWNNFLKAFHLNGEGLKKI